MKTKLFTAAFAVTCVLIVGPAYADALEDDLSISSDSITVTQSIETDDVAAITIATDQLGSQTDEQGSMQPQDDAGQTASGDAQITPPSTDPTPVNPVDVAPGTVAGSKAELTQTQTTSQTTAVAKQDMHRLYNPNSGEHFYTANTYERDFLVRAGWNYEGVGWMAPVTSDSPVYRLYNPNAGDHHYTLSAYERDSLVRVGWNYEGIGWYSASKSEGLAVLRQYNPNASTGSHNFTINSVENMNLVNVGWKAEGIAWYALASDKKTTTNTTTTVIETAPYLTATFTAQSSDVPETIVSYADANETYLFLPSYAALDNIYLAARTAQNAATSLLLAGTGSYITVNSRSPVNLLSLGASRDANGTIKLKFKVSSSGNAFNLNVMQSANIATVYINSNDLNAQGRAYVEASADHSAKASAAICMVDANGAVIYDADTFSSTKTLSTVKGRGNSTWINGVKKPYQISLSTKTDLIGGASKAKKWILLANSADATLLHGSVAFNLAAELGLATVDVRPVDLYYDGEYRGSYLLTEKVEIASGRVDIHDLEKDIENANPGVTLDEQPTAITTNKYGNRFQFVTNVNDPADITGGYLIELDNAYYSKELCWFAVKWPGDGMTAYFVVKSPEVASRNAIAYISQAVQEALNNLGNNILADGAALDNGQFAFDLDSFAKMYLLEEFLKNNDTYTSSTYFYLEQGSKVIMSGPVWDFDAGMGTRTDANDSIQSSYWGYYLETHNTILSGAVKTRVQQIWNNTLKGLISNIVLGNVTAQAPLGKLHSIAYYAKELIASQRMNEVPFGVTAFYNQAKPFVTWSLNVEFFQKWLGWRMQWFDANIARLGEVILTGGGDTRRYNDFDYGLVFDFEYYLDSNPDLRAAGISTPMQALQHFVEYGIRETTRIGKTSRNFNVQAYKENNLDLNFGNNLYAYYMHYCTTGFKEGRVCWY